MEVTEDKQTLAKDESREWLDYLEKMQYDKPTEKISKKTDVKFPIHWSDTFDPSQNRRLLITAKVPADGALTFAEEWNRLPKQPSARSKIALRQENKGRNR